MTQTYAPPTDPITILHRDAHIALVDKPAGLLSVPGKGPELADCLVSRLQGADPEIRLVHRLDRDTSGVMVFARTRAAQRHLGLQFERRHVQKTYVALVGGIPTQKFGEIDLPLIADWPNRPRQMVDHARGKPARTRWRVLERQGDTTRLELTPETGRSHQLRVHLAEIGHPILGDPLYATGPWQRASRMMLHAEFLEIRHPDGGVATGFHAPCPF